MAEKQKAVYAIKEVEDGTAWPFPVSGEALGLGWILRYGQPTCADLLMAASVINAYEYLLYVGTTEEITAKLRMIRRSIKKFREEVSSS